VKLAESRKLRLLYSWEEEYHCVAMGGGWSRPEPIRRRSVGRKKKNVAWLGIDFKKLSSYIGPSKTKFTDVLQ
jgi:hypothetical protein